MGSVFTKGEIAVIKQLLLGKSNKEIADALFVTVSAITEHITKIYKILGVNNRTSAILKLSDEYGPKKAPKDISYWQWAFRYKGEKGPWQLTSLYPSTPDFANCYEVIKLEHTKCILPE